MTELEKTAEKLGFKDISLSNIDDVFVELRCEKMEKQEKLEVTVSGKEMWMVCAFIVAQLRTDDYTLAIFREGKIDRFMGLDLHYV